MTLEYLSSDLGMRFTGRLEERLLHVVHTIIQRIYRNPGGVSAEVPINVRKHLYEVCKVRA